MTMRPDTMCSPPANLNVVAISALRAENLVHGDTRQFILHLCRERHAAYPAISWGHSAQPESSSMSVRDTASARRPTSCRSTASALLHVVHTRAASPTPPPRPPSTGSAPCDASARR